MNISRMVFLSLILTTVIVFAQNQNNDPVLRKKHFNLEKNSVALQGYDAISYFVGKPQKGNNSYTHNYKGVTYLFSSAKNLELFKAAPYKYEPAYGGWCAYAMGNTGEKVEIDPETFKIINNQLYLFYNFYFNNTLKTWNKDEVNLKAEAEKNWMKLYKP